MKITNETYSKIYETITAESDWAYSTGIWYNKKLGLTIEFGWFYGTKLGIAKDSDKNFYCLLPFSNFHPMVSWVSPTIDYIIIPNRYRKQLLKRLKGIQRKRRDNYNLAEKERKSKLNNVVRDRIK